MVDLCLAELVGIVPFAGGSFGFVRCSMGPFWGFMAASVEMVVYAIYTVRTVQKLAQLVTVAALTSPHLEKVWALCAYLAISCLHLRGGNLFWGTMLGCTLFTFFILISYGVGSFMHFDFHKYALDENNGFEAIVPGTSGTLYMRYSYFPMWFYLGICALPLAGQRVKDAHVNIPRAVIASLSTMFVVSIIAVFCVASQYPGIHPILKNIKFILQPGLQHALNINERWIAIMLLVPTFASATGFMFASKHQLASMAESGLMPQFLKKRFGPNQIPMYSIVFSSMLQYAIYLVVDHYLTANYQVTFRLCCSAACMNYILLLIAFITFRVKYTNMKRHFINPFGIVGALIGIYVFGQIFVGLVFYEEGNHAAIMALVVYLILMMIYYFTYVQYVQFFSKEEQSKFMKAYILNANKRRKLSPIVRALRSIRGPPRVPSTMTGDTGSLSSNGGSESGSRHEPSSLSVDRRRTPYLWRSNRVGPEPSEAMGSVVLPGLVEESLMSQIVAVKPSKGSSQSPNQSLRVSLSYSGRNVDVEIESRRAFQFLAEQNNNALISAAISSEANSRDPDADEKASDSIV